MAPPHAPPDLSPKPGPKPNLNLKGSASSGSSRALWTPAMIEEMIMDKILQARVRDSGHGSGIWGQVRVAGPICIKKLLSEVRLGLP